MVYLSQYMYLGLILVVLILVVQLSKILHNIHTRSTISMKTCTTSKQEQGISRLDGCIETEGEKINEKICMGSIKAEWDACRVRKVEEKEVKREKNEN